MLMMNGVYQSMNYVNFLRILEMSISRLKGIGTVLLLWVGLAASPVVTATTISIEPASSAFSVGDTVSLNINITDVTDLYSFQFDIGFSPSILSATSITEGPFLPSGGSTFFLPGTIDNVAGLISFNAGTLIGTIAGVNGGGVLAQVNFSAIGAGTSSVNLSGVTLLDSSLQDISADLVAGSVQVQGGAVPEPGIGSLLFAGLLSLFGSAMIRSRLQLDFGALATKSSIFLNNQWRCTS